MNSTHKSMKSRFWGLLKELFSNSLPVFVAATISRAVTSSIALLSVDLNVLIWVTFCYAFFVAQAVGVSVAICMDHSSLNFNYYINVCSECTGFAWKEFVVMIMLKWLFVNKNMVYASGAWLMVLIGAFVGVHVFNAVLALYYKPPAHIYNALRKFNSDAFALAIAFSFTLVIASELYPASGNLAGADDVIEVANEALEDANSGWYFVAYAFFITAFVALLQWKFGWIVTKEDSEEAELLDARMSFSGETPYDTPQRMVKRDEQYWTSIDSIDEDTASAVAIPSSMNPMNQGGLLRESTSSRRSLPVIRPTHSTTDSLSVFSTCNSCWSYFDNIIFAWDPKGRCRQSLLHLINTVSGYVVGCAWYTFSVLTFQESFLQMRGGEVLGLFLYSVLMTLAVAALMGNVERRQEKKLKAKLKDFGKDPSITHDVVAKFTARYKRNSELALVAGRLVCGWSWSDFITSVFISVLSDREREFTQYKSSNWLSAIIKCVVAVIIVWTGKCVDEHFTRRRLRKLGGGAALTDQEEKLYSNPGSPVGSNLSARDRDDQESKRNTERIFQTVINGKEVFRIPSATANSSHNSESGGIRASLLGGDDSDDEDGDTVVI